MEGFSEKGYQYCEKTTLELKKAYFFEITESLNKTTNSYVFKTAINGKICGLIENTRPTTYNDVKVYTSDPWYSSADVIIRNLKFENISD